LQRDPVQRPTAKELLKHRFIKNAKKTSYLTELIERLERWRAEGGEQDRRVDEGGANDVGRGSTINTTDWDFGTVRHATRPATVRRAPNGLEKGLPQPQPYPTVRRNVLPTNGDTDLPPSAGRAPQQPPPQQTAYEESSEGGTLDGKVTQMNNGSICEGESQVASTVDDDYDDAVSILDSVVLPVLDSVGPALVRIAALPKCTLFISFQIANRITNPSAHAAVLKLRRAMEEAEKDVPGLMNVLVSDLVDSVEQVDDTEE
jgi:serine/threonine-protein kinase 24/25/MST4